MRLVVLRAPTPHRGAGEPTYLVRAPKILPKDTKKPWYVTSLNRQIELPVGVQMNLVGYQKRSARL